MKCAFRDNSCMRRSRWEYRVLSVRRVGHWCASLAFVNVLGLALGAVAAERQYGPGVSETEIKIGNTMPYSGPASAYAVLGKAMSAYVRMINEHGGINGRKIVPLSDLALGIIEEALADADGSEFVFPSDGGPMPARSVAKTIIRATEITAEHPKGRFGLAPFATHDLRRTALTGMAKLGVAPIVIGHVANHRTTTPLQGRCGTEDSGRHNPRVEEICSDYSANKRFGVASERASARGV